MWHLYLIHVHIFSYIRVKRLRLPVHEMYFRIGSSLLLSSLMVRDSRDTCHNKPDSLVTELEG